MYIVLCEIDVFHHRHVGCSAAPCGFHTSMSMSRRSRAFSDGFDVLLDLWVFRWLSFELKLCVDSLDVEMHWD